MANLIEKYKEILNPFKKKLSEFSLGNTPQQRRNVLGTVTKGVVKDTGNAIKQGYNSTIRYNDTLKKPSLLLKDPTLKQNVKDFTSGNRDLREELKAFDTDPYAQNKFTKNPYLNYVKRQGLGQMQTGSYVLSGGRDVNLGVNKWKSGDKLGGLGTAGLGGLQVAGGVFGFTPVGQKWNQAERQGFGALGSVLRGENVLEGASKGLAGDTMLSEGLGISNPIAGAVTDLTYGVVSANPKLLQKAVNVLSKNARKVKFNPRELKEMETAFELAQKSGRAYVDTNGQKFFRDAENKIQQVGKGYAKTPTKTIRVRREIPVTIMGEKAKPVVMIDEKTVPALGVVGGVEFETDENGQLTGISFDGTKAAMGVALAYGGTKAIKNKDDIAKMTKNIADTEGKPKKPVDVYKEMLGNKKVEQAPDEMFNPAELLDEARGKIGSITPPKSSTKQRIKDWSDSFYTQWVDRYNPVVQASKQVKKQLKSQGAELLPQSDPEYLVRRLSGAGGIADRRYSEELKPIITRMDEYGINKLDMDTYLANRRMAGFGDVGRDIKGVDVEKSRKIVKALEDKYGDNIKGVAKELYAYQDRAFKELVDGGFLSQADAVKIRSQNPDYAPLYRVMDEVDNYLGLPTRKLQQGTQPVQKIKGSNRNIESPLESIIANTYSHRAAIEKNKVARSIVGLQNATDLGFKKVSKSSPSTITVWKDGKKEYWEVGEDIAEVSKGLNEETMNTLLKIFTAPASLLRQGATGRNPAFMIPNIIRDQLDAGITSKYGYVPFLDYVRGLRSILKQDEIYKSWENSGAKIDLGEMSGRKSVQKSFDDKTARKSLFKWVSEGLDVMGKYSEQPTRVGLYGKAYKKTGNELLSALESRDATVDFARMGSKMKVANSIIPFLNVGVQGFDKLIRATKGNPKKVLLNASLYAGTPAVTITAYNLLTHPEEYAKVPQYEKDSNFVIVTGSNPDGTVNYITIPKGNIVPIVANPIESFMSYVAGVNSQKFGEFATQFISQTLPVVSEGYTPKEVAVKTIGSNMPTLIKPITENLVNKSFYKYDSKNAQSKEIVPFYLKDKEAYKQAYEWTPKMYKAIGSVFNVSPLQVQNLMEGYLAGYTKNPASIIDTVSKAANGEKISPNDLMLVSRFINQTYPTSGSSAKAEKPKTPLVKRLSTEVSASSKLDLSKPEAEKLYEKDVKFLSTYKDKKIEIENDYSLDADQKADKLDKLNIKFQESLQRSGQLQEVTGKKESVQSAINKFKYGIDDYEKMQTGGLVSQKKKEDKAWTIAKSIFTDYDSGQLSVEQAGELIKQVGLKPVDVGYYVVATSDRDIRRAYVNSVMIEATKNKQDVISSLATLRKEVKGERVLSDTVIDDLYRDGYINATQKSYLKKVKDDGKGTVTTKGTGGKSSSKKLKSVELVKPKLGSTSYPKSTRRSASYRGKYDTNYINKALGVDTSRLLSGLPLN